MKAMVATAASAEVNRSFYRVINALFVPAKDFLNYLILGQSTKSVRHTVNDALLTLARLFSDIYAHYVANDNNFCASYLSYPHRNDPITNR
jgi:hypothetical protein